MPIDSRELLAIGIFGNKSVIGSRIETLLRRGGNFSPFSSRRRVAQCVIALAALTAAGSFAPRWLLIEPAALAQTTPLPSFEVASVKPAGPRGEGARTGVFFTAGGSFETLGAPVRMILTTAFDVRDYQISGAPGWVDADKFDIQAKAASESANIDQRRLMVQSLLAARFHLIVHRETREGQIYELAIAKGGPRLRAATESLHGSPQGLGGRGRGSLYGMACPLRLLVNQLSQELGRPVVDKTGLSGLYDFTLKWTPDAAGAAPGADAGQSAGDNPPPSLFTAVQEALGLRLQAVKGPVETLVIDRLEKPDAN